MTDFLVQKLVEAKKTQKTELKKLYIKKNYSSVSARKLKCPSSARLGSELSQLGLARAGKFQLEPITSKQPLIALFFFLKAENNALADFLF